MSATVMNGGDAAAVEVEFAACDCCGLMEECTPAYIAGVRERHGGRWICGLCAEAVQDEIRRSGPLISLEEAMGRHASFRRSFRSAEAAAVDPAEQLISAVRQLLRRNLDSPRAVRSTPGSPRTMYQDGLIYGSFGGPEDKPKTTHGELTLSISTHRHRDIRDRGSRDLPQGSRSPDLRAGPPPAAGGARRGPGTAAATGAEEPAEHRPASPPSPPPRPSVSNRRRGVTTSGRPAVALKCRGSSGRRLRAVTSWVRVEEDTCVAEAFSQWWALGVFIPELYMLLRALGLGELKERHKDAAT
ncbi:hypothetical protein BHE74_00031143 [Ensete ventricosum]|nr:hypothetical protein BHE74_00031143 [Ensete ventricosum]